MLETPAPQCEAWLGDARPAGHLVGRDAETDRLLTFLAKAGTHGEALLVSGLDQPVPALDGLRQLPAVIPYTGLRADAVGHADREGG